MASIFDPTIGASMEVKPDRRAQVNTPTDPTLAGFVRLADVDGNGIGTTENGALNVSEDCPIIWDQVDGSSLNTNVWSSTGSAMTIGQVNGFITLNSGAATTANAFAILNSVKVIPLYAQLPLRCTFNLKVPVQPQANLTMEIGVGSVVGNAAPTDGAFFRWNASTQFLAIINNAGNETTSIPLSAPVSNIVDIFEIVLVEDLVQFFVGDVLVATVQVPDGIAYPTNAGRLPIFARVYNGASPPGAAPQISIGQVFVAQQAMKQNKTWGETTAVLGRGFYQSPIAPFGQTTNHTNSMVLNGATLTNTGAAYSSFGGKFSIASQVPGTGDGIVFGFQNFNGYQGFIYGVAISTVIAGAATVSPTILDWSLGVNSSALSLATVDGSGIAPRRIPLGVQGFLAAAGVGTMSNDLVRNFPVPIPVDSNRFVHVILATPTGAATSSLNYRGSVTILGGYFE